MLIEIWVEKGIWFMLYIRDHDMVTGLVGRMLNDKVVSR